MWSCSLQSAGTRGSRRSRSRTGPPSWSPSAHREAGSGISGAAGPEDACEGLAEVGPVQRRHRRHASRRPGRAEEAATYRDADPWPDSSTNTARSGCRTRRCVTTCGCDGHRSTSRAADVRRRTSPSTTDRARRSRSTSARSGLSWVGEDQVLHIRALARPLGDAIHRVYPTQAHTGDRTWHASRRGSTFAQLLTSPSLHGGWANPRGLRSRPAALHAQQLVGLSLRNRPAQIRSASLIVR